MFSEQSNIEQGNKLERVKKEVLVDRLKSLTGELNQLAENIGIDENTQKIKEISSEIAEIANKIREAE